MTGNIRRVYAAGFTSVLLVAAFLALWHIGTKPLWDYDEATYAQVTHEMLQSRDVATLTYRHEYFFEKPPLYIWLAAGTSRILGESELSMRVPSALAFVALVGVSMLLAFELSFDAVAGLLCGAVVLTTSALLEPARQMRFDVLVTLWIVLAAYGFVRGLRQERWFLVFGISVGLAALTKSVIAIFALAAAPVFGVWMHNYAWLKSKYFWSGVAAGALVFLPWHIVEAAKYGGRFWDEYIHYTVSQRFRLELFNAKSATNQDYIWFMVNFAAPWTQVFVMGVVPVALYWTNIPLRMRNGIGASVSMVLLVVAVFFSAATKAPTYLLPLYPFAALAISLALAAAIRQVSRTVQSISLLLVGVLLSLGLSSSVYNGYHQNPYYLTTDTLSNEERAVGLLVKGHPGTWYAFNNFREVGSAMYYSQNTDPMMLTGASLLKAGDLVVMYQSQRLAFFAEHKGVATVALLDGSQLLLLEVVSQM